MRLHPLSPLVRFGRHFVLLVIVVLQLTAVAGNGGWSPTDWLNVAIVVIALAASVVSWLVTRWRVHGSELQIDTGLIRRRSVRVPLARIQGIDVVRPVLARLLSLAELRVVVAGSGRSHSSLACLTEAEAWKVRAQLLALAQGAETPASANPAPMGGDIADSGIAEATDPVTVTGLGPARGAWQPPVLAGRSWAAEEGERPLFRVSNGQLVVATLLTSLATVTLVGVAFVVAVTASNPGAGAAATAVAPLVLLFTAAPLALIRIGAEFEFAVAESIHGLRLHAGMLQTRTEVVPEGRIQAVRWVQPLLWRAFGWCRLELDVARQGGVSPHEERLVTRALMPVGTISTAETLLAAVFPGASVVPPPEARPPVAARLRVPLQYLALRSWAGDDYVIARTGRFTWRTVVVPVAKVQSIRYAQGPWQRALRLATVHVDTAGRRWRATACCRHQDDAMGFVYSVAAMARTARAASRTAVSDEARIPAL
jgi:putative membrane protein